MSNAAICLECGGSFLRRRAHHIFCKPGCARKYNGRKYRNIREVLREEANKDPRVEARRIGGEIMALCQKLHEGKLTKAEYRRQAELLVAELESLCAVTQ